MVGLPMKQNSCKAYYVSTLRKLVIIDGVHGMNGIVINWGWLCPVL